MDHWNYRVMVESVPIADTGDHTECHAIIEAYYESGEIVAWCAAKPLGDDIDDLRDTLSRMLEACGREPVNRSDLPGDREQVASDASDPRKVVLDGAAQAVLTDRRNVYGPAEDNFLNIARLWTEWLHARFRAVGASTEFRFTRSDVAVMMDLMKTARLVQTPDHPDTWTDKAGYSACGLQAALADAQERSR